MTRGSLTIAERGVHACDPGTEHDGARADSVEAAPGERVVGLCQADGMSH
jgi:hypothetical protein